MKKLIAFLVLVTMLSACNEPLRNGRNSYNSSSSNSGYQLGSGTGSNIVYVTPTPTATSGTSSGSSSSIPSEVSHCSWSTDGSSGYASSSNYLGSYTACKSKSDSSVIWVQVKTIPSTPLCLIPTTTDSSGGSLNIGNPVCKTITDSKTLYSFSLTKTRSGYESSAINGVMMIKDQVPYYYPYPYNAPLYSVDAYLRCMYFTFYYKNPYFCAAYKTAGQYTHHVF